MKIKIAKIILLVACVGLFIFLLLPFLETTPPPTQAMLKTQPQVVSDNPLTAVAKRLRSLFGGKERHTHRLTQADQWAPASQSVDEFLASAASNKPEPDQSDAPALATTPTHTIEVPPTEEPFDFGDATLQTDQGGWILIQQTTPQAGQPGMHEINVHDNPYDRYMKQERTRRALPQQPKQEIPDSKWARLVRPIKRFFGLDTPTAVDPSPISVSQSTSRARTLASVDNNKRANLKYPTWNASRSPWPDITLEEWSQMTPQQRTHERDRRSVAQFMDFLSGDRAAEEAAQIMANIQYPAPQNKEEEQAKAEYMQQLTEQNKQTVNEAIFQLLQQRAEGKEPVDELPDMMGCKSTSLPNTSGFCELTPDGHSVPPSTTPPSIIEQEQIKNAQDFSQQTGFEFPKGLPVTPVLGPTTWENISAMSGPDEDTQQTAEIYKFLYEYNNCANEPCFWVANSKQRDPQLGESATMANTILAGDPLGKYSSWGEAFEQHKVEQLGEDASEEQKKKVREEAKKQWEQNAVHYLSYNTELLREAQQQKKSLLVFNDRTLGPAVFTIFGNGGFTTTLTPLKDAETNIRTGHLITRSLGQEANDRMAIISGQIIKPAISADITHSLNQNKQNKPSGKGIKAAFKNWKMNK